MKYITAKKKAKKCKAIIKCGFSEQDIIDAADSILDKLTIPQMLGQDNGKGRKVVKEGSKASRRESYAKGQKQVKDKSKKVKKA